MISTVEDLVGQLETVPDINRFSYAYENLVDAMEFSPDSRLARQALAAYTKEVSQYITRPSEEYVLSEEFAELPGVTKADIVRGIFRPAGEHGFRLVVEATKDLYNSVLEMRGETSRMSDGLFDFERWDQLDGGIIHHTVDNHDEWAASKTLVRGYDQMVKSGNRDTVLQSLLDLQAREGRRIQAYRSVMSSNPCDYCKRHDGAPIRTKTTGEIYETTRGGVGTGNFRERRRDFILGEDIIKFHDNCSCELYIDTL